MVSVAPGEFYIIQLMPDIAPQRVKLGWASKVERRLAQHQAAAPTAKVVATWPCDGIAAEQLAIRTITASGCRAISREVFDCDDLDGLVRRAEAFFHSHVPNDEDDYAGHSTIATLLNDLRPKVDLVCARCGAPFTSYPGTLYHDNACRLAAYYDANRERLNKAAAERQKRKRQAARTAQEPDPNTSS